MHKTNNTLQITEVLPEHPTKIPQEHSRAQCMAFASKQLSVCPILADPPVSPVAYRVLQALSLDHADSTSYMPSPPKSTLKDF